MAIATLKTSDGSIGIISIYLEEDQPIEQDLEKLKEVCEKLQLEKILVGGDSNAWSTWWGSVEENHRGEAVVGALEELRMEVLNEGRTPTFYTYRGEKLFQSHVDITACTTNMLGAVHGWGVDQGITSSDHNAIVFTIRMEKPVNIRKKNTTRKYNTNKAKWIEFRHILKQNLAKEKLKANVIQESDTKKNWKNT